MTKWSKRTSMSEIGQRGQGLGPKAGLVISLYRDCIANVPLGPKSNAASQSFSQEVLVATLDARMVLLCFKASLCSSSRSLLQITFLTPLQPISRLSTFSVRWRVHVRMRNMMSCRAGARLCRVHVARMHVRTCICMHV